MERMQLAATGGHLGETQVEERSQARWAIGLGTQAQHSVFYSAGVNDIGPSEQR